MAGYISMYAVLELHSTVLNRYNVLCFILSFIPCFFLGSSYAFGEAAIIAYLRLFPKTLIGGFSSGTGLSGLLSGILNLTSQLVDELSLKYLYLILAPVGLIYLFLFMCTFRILKSQERKIEREDKKSFSDMNIERSSSINDYNNNIKDEKNEINEDENNGKYEENEEKEDEISLRVAEDKEMEDMNKANQVINCENFKRVMRTVGRVIINLGLIYFLQFFCVNTLIIKACDLKDIDFLPTQCRNCQEHRKGKFEFINLSYQLGMFLSKSFIKIVRKIQPIEIFTIAIGIINILYIFENIFSFIHWSIFLVIGLILGFFSGGVYAGGFYTILNSDRVQKNYKELTVNIATIFNDSGTFLSGIIGFVTYKYILTKPEYIVGNCTNTNKD